MSRRMNRFKSWWSKGTSKDNYRFNNWSSFIWGWWLKRKSFCNLIEMQTNRSVISPRWKFKSKTCRSSNKKSLMRRNRRDSSSKSNRKGSWQKWPQRKMKPKRLGALSRSSSKIRLQSLRLRSPRHREWSDRKRGLSKEIGTCRGLSSKKKLRLLRNKNKSWRTVWPSRKDSIKLNNKLLTMKYFLSSTLLLNNLRYQRTMSHIIGSGRQSY